MTLTGIVKWFNKEKGFGFITHDNKDYFAHYKSINMKGFKILEDGQQVNFEARKDEKGLKAENIVAV